MVLNESATNKMMYTTQDYNSGKSQDNSTSSGGGGSIGGGGNSVGGVTAKKLYAKAIYENIAESPDELAFKRGDILTIIEQDTDGLTGWWLCTLRGRQGICPGNRLKLITSTTTTTSTSSYDPGCYTPSPVSSPCPSSISGGTTTSLYNSSCSQSLSSSIHQSDNMYENTSMMAMISLQQQQQKHGKRRSWHIMPNKVITPQKCGDVYWYDLLPTPPPSNRSSTSPYANISQMSDQETYDTPKPPVHINYDAPRASWSRMSPQQHLQQHQQQQQQHLQQQQQQQQQQQPRLDDSYDIPRPSTLLSQHNITPSSSNSSLLTTTSDSLSLSSSNRSSLANMPDYDIPRRNPTSIRSQTPSSLSSLSVTNNSTYDIPPQMQPPNTIQTHYHQQQSIYALHAKQQQQQQQQQNITKKELPLELSSALDTLAKLQNETTSAITRLLGFVSPNWRSKDKIEPIIMDIKLAAVRLRTALHDLAEFGDGALGNAARADDKGLAIKLRPLVKSLRDADYLVLEASQSLDAQGWTIETLCRNENMSVIQKQQMGISPDSLDQLIACAQTLTDDVRQSTSFIQGNATLLFKRGNLSPSELSASGGGGGVGGGNGVGGGANNNGEWLEDYDYVSLESKEASAKKNAELRDALPHDLQTKFDNCVKNAESAAIANEKPALNANDKSLLVYYATQTVTHMGYLTQAIDAFLQTVERNQPPKFFLAYGKFVVLSAHNLVNIGDIVHRNVSLMDVKKRVLQCADSLSEALKTCVTKTKKAAQHFPSVTSVQEMVDSVVDISHSAYDLKIAMLQVVQQ